MGTDWGSVPDWVQAIGASGALIYIAVQSHRDRLKDRWERQKEREAQEESNRLRRDAEAEQARRVSFQLTTESADELAWTVRVGNDSGSAIRDVSLCVSNAEGQNLNPVGSTKLPDGMVIRPANDIERIDPGQEDELRFEFEGDRRIFYEEDALDLDDGCSWIVYFTDAAGRRWLRRGDSTNRVGSPERADKA